jgi:hypothetical protein
MISVSGNKNGLKIGTIFNPFLFPETEIMMLYSL